MNAREQIVDAANELDELDKQIKATRKKLFAALRKGMEDKGLAKKIEKIDYRIPRKLQAGYMSDFPSSVLANLKDLK